MMHCFAVEFTVAPPIRAAVLERLAEHHEKETDAEGLAKFLRVCKHLIDFCAEKEKEIVLFQRALTRVTQLQHVVSPNQTQSTLGQLLHVVSHTSCVTPAVDGSVVVEPRGAPSLTCAAQTSGEASELQYQVSGHDRGYGGTEGEMLGGAAALSLADFKQLYNAVLRECTAD